MPEPETDTAPETPADAPEAAADAVKAPETDWKAEARKWEQRAKDNAAKFRDAEPKLAEYEQMVAANQTEAQRQAAELARWQTEAETWRGTAQSARIQALAADFADPDDAVAALAGRNYLDAGNQIDDATIAADLADVLEKKPHWRKPVAAPAGPPAPRAPAPNLNQGAGGTKPSDPREEFAALIRGGLVK